jgi:hypothetical protein
MFKTNFLPENPSYPQELKFPDTVNNNLKIKYHYLDTTFKAEDIGGTGVQTTFVANMNAEGSNLQKNYKNVKSIELTSAMFLKNDIEDEGEEVIYMHIDELEGVIDSNKLGGQNAFAKLVFDTTGTTVTGYVIAQLNCGMNPILEYETKGKRLDKMTIRFKPTAVVSGIQTVPADIEFTEHFIVSLTFKIGVIEPIIPA